MWSDEEALRIYNLVLSGEQGRIPAGFWQGQGGQDRTVLCLRHAIVTLLGATTKQAVLQAATRKMITRYKLLEPIRLVGNLYSLFDKVFPEYDILPWEMQQMPSGFWGRPPVRSAFLRWWLQEHRLTARQAAQLLIDDGGVRTRLKQEGYQRFLQQVNLYAELQRLDSTIATRPVSPLDHHNAIKLAGGKQKLQRLRKAIGQPCPECGQLCVLLNSHLRVHKVGQTVEVGVKARAYFSQVNSRSAATRSASDLGRRQMRLLGRRLAAYDKTLELERSLAKYPTNPLVVARVAHGWSQVDLAHILGITHGYISSIERGKVQPSAALQARIVTTLGLDEDTNSNSNSIS